MNRVHAFYCLALLPLLAVGPQQESKPPVVTEYHSVQAALDFHLQDLKAHISTYNHIFVVMELAQMTSADRVVFVENGLNARYLHRGDRDYLVKVVLNVARTGQTISIANFRVRKISNTHLDLTNLNNGRIYLIQ